MDRLSFVYLSFTTASNCGILIGPSFNFVNMPNAILLLIPSCQEQEDNFSQLNLKKSLVFFTQFRGLFTNNEPLLLSLCRALWRIFRAKMENLAG